MSVRNPSSSSRAPELRRETVPEIEFAPAGTMTDAQILAEETRILNISSCKALRALLKGHQTQLTSEGRGRHGKVNPLGSNSGSPDTKQLKDLNALANDRVRGCSSKSK
jgi:hypothetical protein